MKKSLILCGFVSLMLFNSVQAQTTPSPLEIVQAQLDAYNKQDIEAFARVFSTDVEVFNAMGDTVPSLKGRTAVYERYAALFKKYPKNYSTLTGRVIQGDFVIDHEYVTGRENPTRIVAIYEVKEGFIVRCWFIR